MEPVVRLDHLVFATDSLERTVAAIGSSLGVAPGPGGQHLGVGTRNYLLAFEEGGYLEVIGPDPDQPTPDAPRPFGIDDIIGERLVTWAMSTSDMAATLASARAAGYDPGPARSMSRRLPDGSLLSWQITTPPLGTDGGAIPFVIDWGTGADVGATHPSRTAPKCRLLAFEVGGEGVAAALSALRAPVEAGASSTCVRARIGHGGKALDL